MLGTTRKLVYQLIEHLYYQPEDLLSEDLEEPVTDLSPSKDVLQNQINGMHRTLIAQLLKMKHLKKLPSFPIQC